jgi:hypothetical protein
MSYSHPDKRKSLSAKAEGLCFFEATKACFQEQRENKDLK